MTTMPDSTLSNILVTGGAGFIGCNFVRYILAQQPSARVVNLDALTYAGSLSNLKDLKDGDRYTFVRGDIGDAALVKRTLEEWAIDAIVNFAAESHVDRSITGPAAFIKPTSSARSPVGSGPHRLGGPVRQVPIPARLDRRSVRNPLADGPGVRRDDPYAPNSPYAASKASSDHLVRAYHHTYGVQTLTTNCSNNYGPFQYPEKLIPLMILNALLGKGLPVYGDGLQVRDWLYVEDHCAAIHTVLTRGRPGETYNIGGRTERQNIQIIHLIATSSTGCVRNRAAAIATRSPT